MHYSVTRALFASQAKGGPAGLIRDPILKRDVTSHYHAGAYVISSRNGSG